MNPQWLDLAMYYLNTTDVTASGVKKYLKVIL